MQHDNEPGVLGEIEAMLEEERTALHCADFARFAPLSALKEKLLAQLGEEPSPVDGDAIARIRRAAQRNQRLLLASMRGVKAAQARFAAIRGIQNRLNTYDNLGRRQDVQLEGGSLEHRV